VSTNNFTPFPDTFRFQIKMASRPKKAIIIAAGMGNRLRPFTDNIPKGLVTVAGKPMIVRCLECLRNVGVEEFVIIRGYKADVFTTPEWLEKLGKGVRFVDNLDYEKNNIMLSFYKAEKEWANEESFYFSYADIIYSQEVANTLADTPGDFALVVDKEYAKVYVGRTDHPLSQGELCTLDSEGHIKQVGKCSCEFSEAIGEFIGLGKVSGKGAKLLADTYHELQKDHESSDKSFVRAPKWSQSYMCDMLQHLIDKKGAKMVPAMIYGNWREIDTVQDKNNADREVKW